MVVGASELLRDLILGLLVALVGALVRDSGAESLIGSRIAIEADHFFIQCRRWHHVVPRVGADGVDVFSCIIIFILVLVEVPCCFLSSSRLLVVEVLLLLLLVVVVV